MDGRRLLAVCGVVVASGCTFSERSFRELDGAADVVPADDVIALPDAVSPPDTATTTTTQRSCSLAVEGCGMVSVPGGTFTMGEAQADGGVAAYLAQPIQPSITVSTLQQ